MRLLDYEYQTAFWDDFDIADRFGVETIRDTYKRAKAEWKDNRIYGTELSMVLNHKCWYWYSKPRSKLGDEYGKLYAELWEEFDNWILDNWKGEKLRYYLKITD